MIGEIGVILVLFDNLHNIAQESKASERVKNSTTLPSNNIKQHKQHKQHKYTVFTQNRTESFNRIMKSICFNYNTIDICKIDMVSHKKHRIIGTNACLIKSSTVFSVLYHFASIVTHLNVSMIVHYLCIPGILLV